MNKSDSGVFIFKTLFSIVKNIIELFQVAPYIDFVNALPQLYILINS